MTEKEKQEEKEFSAKYSEILDLSIKYIFVDFYVSDFDPSDVTKENVDYYLGLFRFIDAGGNAYEYPPFRKMHGLDDVDENTEILF